MQRQPQHRQRGQARLFRRQCPHPCRQTQRRAHAEAQSGCHRAELSYAGEPGTAAAIASALRGWNHLRFEVTEDPTSQSEGARYSYTPDLGVFHAVTGLHGDIMIPEDRLKAAVVKAALGDTTLLLEVDKLLGKPWDDELETFRHAGDGAAVRWLHQVV